LIAPSGNLAQGVTRALKTFEAQSRNVVGVEDSRVRFSALSIPLLLAIHISTLPWAIASDIPRPISRALNASFEICSNRTGLPRTSDKIWDMSLYERS